jgi:hypothetical protein
MIKRKLPKVKCQPIGKVTEKAFTDVKLTFQLHYLSFLSILSLFSLHSSSSSTITIFSKLYILVALGTLPDEYFMTTYRLFFFKDHDTSKESKAARNNCFYQCDTITSTKGCQRCCAYKTHEQNW